MSNKPSQQDQQSNGRNEYIPAYISKAPFYAQGLSDSDYLEHQRLQGAPQDTLDKAKWYERGRKTGPAATKYRKGACENCGAMTHKTKECLSRPRKQGAKWTGRDIQADERVEDVKLGWDAKRDRWNGYDSREYAAVIQEHEELEALRKAAKPQADQKQITEDGEHDGTELKDDSEARYAEETDMGRGQSNATRQLRLREDTAKYLLNLDLDSAKYDPKTRSMDTTSQNLNQNADSAAEEGFVRPTTASDDAAAFERAQRYAWETQELASKSNNSTNSKLHLQANPTEGEFLLKKRQQEESTRKAAQRQALLEKYGDQPHLSSTSAAAQPFKPTTTSTESYIEYDPKTGKPKPQFNPNKIKSQPRSKYAEDILTNNHTSVWGSWWNDFRWGYACCHSTTKNSYCTGEQGKTAFEEAEGLRTGLTLPLLEQSQSQSQMQQRSEKQVDENETKSPSKKRRKTDNDEDNDDNDNDIKNEEEGIQKLRLEQQGEDLQFRKDREVVDTTPTTTTHIDTSGRKQQNHKRTFGDMHDSSVTEEEMESYKRSRAAADDPMKAFGHLGGDGILEHESVPAS